MDWIRLLAEFSLAYVCDRLGWDLVDGWMDGWMDGLELRTLIEDPDYLALIVYNL